MVFRKVDNKEKLTPSLKKFYNWPMGLIFTFIFILLSSTWASGTYTLEDLKVLAKEESHQEFFQHALDIRPSERQDEWRSMATKMADIFSQKVLNKTEIERGDFLKIEELYRWPAMKNDDIFKVRRQAIGIRFIKNCLKSDSPCWGDLKDFWEIDKSDPDTAFKLAELTSSFDNPPLSSWNFLEVALKSPLSEFYCKKEFAMETLWRKIEIDYIKLGSQGDLLKKIDQTVHPDCLPSLISEAHKRLENPGKVSDRELAFQILKSQNKDTTAVADLFYTIYLLENPAQGELFNYSWNRVRELGRKASRREEVLRKLKNLDPLPDSIFTTLDQTKKRVVLKHFKNYFPEYLDHYTHQCLNFYSGKGSFPRGNPTIHCQDFMNSELAPLIIEEDKIKKFQDVRRI